MKLDIKDILTGCVLWIMAIFNIGYTFYSSRNLTFGVDTSCYNKPMWEYILFPIIFLIFAFFFVKIVKENKKKNLKSKLNLINSKIFWLAIVPIFITFFAIALCSRGY